MYWYSTWYDDIVTISGTSASSIDFKVTCDGVDVFYGRAYRLPGEDDFKINLTKIAQQYIESPYLPEEALGCYSGVTFPANGFFEYGPVGYLVLYVRENGQWVSRHTAYFVWDYDYDHGGYVGGPNVVGSSWLGDRICDYYIAGQMRFSNNTMEVRDKRFHLTIEFFPVPNPSVNVWIPACGRYALVYVNARGGFDSFPILGTSLMKQSITRHQIDRVGSWPVRGFETDTYASELATSWELNTHYLTDEQSAKLAKHLLGSNKVYLQDIEKQVITPVVITDSNVTYQTYQTNGKRLSQYTINVTESQKKIRR